MRVLFLTHNFPRWTGDVSGAFLATLAGALQRRGHEVRVIAPSDGGDPGAPEYDGIPVTRVRYAAPAQETLAYRGNMQEAIRHPERWRALVGLWRALRTEAESHCRRGAAVVHAHWWVPGGMAAPPGCPMVLTVHGTDGALLRRSALARWVAAPVFRRARVVTTVSHSLAATVQAALGRTVPPECVQPMPADVSGFRADGGGTGLIVVSRLTPQKRVDLAIRAVAALNQQGNPAPLQIVGEGALRGELESLTDTLGLRSLVTFRGALAPDAVPAALRTARVMLFPARGEGFGLVAAEAFMSGVPVVACRDGGGALDVVPESGAGRWADPDPASVAAAARSLLEDPDAPAAAARLGETWRERVSPETVAAACERWYQRALGGGPSSAGGRA